MPEAASWESGWVVERFWGAYAVISQLPDVCPTGFLTTYAAAVVMLPVILYATLAMVWSLAAVGPARKFMTTFFILFLGIPLYPILTFLLLAVFWFVAGILGFVLVTLGAIALVAFLWWQLIDAKVRFVRRQQETRVQTEDISCMHLSLGMVLGVSSLCTFGLCAFACTIIKAPFLLISGFIQAWWRFGKAWLELVRSPNVDSCCLWWWFPLILATFIVLVALGVCAAMMLIPVSALVKLLVSAIWPAYVTAGWLRFVGQRGTRRHDRSCFAAVEQGVKAAYQVLWASDVFTNALILGKLDKFAYLDDYVRGRRDDLDEEFRDLSCLPPVLVGLFGGSWDLAQQAIAEQLGIGKDDVEEAWRSLARQMIRIGREAVDDDMVTEKWVMSIPAELCIGLPARTMLETLERSPVDGEIVLSSGLVLRHSDRPRGEFFDKMWQHLMEARDARWAVQLSKADRDCLCAALLAGGGSVDDLPPTLKTAVLSFEQLPAARHSACQAILRPLVAASLMCSRSEAFKSKLALTIEAITSDNVTDYMILRQHNESGEETDVEGFVGL